MSDPSHMFEGLSLSEMPVTRSQVSRSHPRGTGTSRGRAPTRGRPTQRNVAMIHIQSGQRYDTQLLSPLSAERAIEGLESDFLVERIQDYGSGGSGYFAFQLRTPVAVRIHAPTDGRAMPECTCEAYRRTRSPCAHIYWLFVGLNDILNDEQAIAAQGHTQIEMTSRLNDLYPLIREQQVSLHYDLNKSRRRAVEESDSEDSVMEDTGVIESRTSGIDLNVICDILSSFDENLTPDEFRREVADRVELGSSSDGSSVPKSLSSLMFRIACDDPSFYQRLEREVPREMRAGRYYEKQYARAVETLRQLSTYSQMSPTARMLPEVLHMDVPQCGSRLRLIVHRMCEDLDARNAVAPLSTLVTTRLAEYLVELIRHVIGFDRDIPEDATWHNSPPLNSHPRDRNLFAYLIGDPPVDPSLTSWMTNRFVIDRLQDFPTTTWRHLLETLTTLKEGIEEMNIDSMPKASGFAAGIDDMLQDYTATAEEPSSSSAQTPRHALN